MDTVKAIAAIFLAVGLTACAIQRAQIAGDAQNKMIGLSKEQVLACMGVPAAKATEGITEVWSYSSGNNQTVVSTFGSASRGTFSGGGIAESRYCTVNVTMVNGRVSQMNYIGPTGGLLTPNEQCAFAVQNCTK